MRYGVVLSCVMLLFVNGITAKRSSSGRSFGRSSIQSSEGRYRRSNLSPTAKFHNQKYSFKATFNGTCENVFGFGCLQRTDPDFKVFIKAGPVDSATSPNASSYASSDIGVRIVVKQIPFAYVPIAIAVRLPASLGAWNMTAIKISTGLLYNGLTARSCISENSLDTLFQMSLNARNHVEYVFTPNLTAWGESPTLMGMLEVTVMNLKGRIWNYSICVAVKNKQSLSSSIQSISTRYFKPDSWRAYINRRNETLEKLCSEQEAKTAANERLFVVFQKDFDSARYHFKNDYASINRRALQVKDIEQAANDFKDEENLAFRQESPFGRAHNFVCGLAGCRTLCFFVIFAHLLLTLCIDHYR